MGKTIGITNLLRWLTLMIDYPRRRCIQGHVTCLYFGKWLIIYRKPWKIEK